MSDGMTREERAWCSGITTEKPLNAPFQTAVSKKSATVTLDDFEERFEHQHRAKQIDRFLSPEIDVRIPRPTR